MTKEINYSIQELLGVGMTLIVLGIGIAYGLDVLTDVREDFVSNTQSAGTGNGCNATHRTDCTLEYNATQNAVVGVGKIPEKLPTIATVVVASVIIGVLLTYLWARFSNM
jgi:hypothetical protein